MSLKQKVIAIVLLLVTAYAASVAVGVYRIKSSELYPITEKALAAYLKSINSDEAAGPFQMKWYAPWQYSASASKGLARYKLCTTSKRCYPMTATKIDGVWHIDWNFYKKVTSSSD